MSASVHHGPGSDSASTSSVYHLQSSVARQLAPAATMSGHILKNLMLFKRFATLHIQTVDRQVIPDGQGCSISGVRVVEIIANVRISSKGGAESSVDAVTCEKTQAVAAPAESSDSFALRSTLEMYY